jgi:tetratricopeptide (TPR) repeat protein
MRGLPYTGLLCLLLCVYQTHGQMTATAFDDANKLYEQGKFPEAAAAYQKLLNSGQGSTAVFFNLGNAFFKAGQIGRAIVAYRQAELLSPRDSDLRANLQFARNQVQGPTVIPNRRAQWLAHLTINEWSWLAAGALWMWFALLTVGQFRPPLRPVLRNYVLLLGTAIGVLSACLALALREHLSPPAIVIARDATVRQAPIDEAQSAFTVHDGAELQILDRKDDWFQVTTDPRRIGWLRRDQVLVP